MANIPRETYDQLKALIASDDSPVGIDATKTHIHILYRLMEIERKLDALCAASDKTA